MRILKGVLEGAGLLFLIVGVSAIDSEGKFMLIALVVAGLGCFLLYINSKLPNEITAKKTDFKRLNLRAIKGGKHYV